MWRIFNKMVEISIIPDTIPRKLHFIWVGNDFENEEDPVVNEKYIENMLEWQRAHPGYSCKLWGDKEVKELILDDFPDLESLYKNYHYPVMRADLARILILEKEGGVYIDMDVKLKKSVESLLKSLDGEDRMFVPGVQDKWLSRRMSNWLIIGKPHLLEYSDFRDKAIELESKSVPMKWLDAIQVHQKGLSPRVFNEILEDSSMLKEVDVGNCGHCATVLGACKAPDTVYFVHDYDGSWTVSQALQPILCSAFYHGPTAGLFLLLMLLLVFTNKIFKR